MMCDSIVHTHLSTTTECYWPTAIVYVDSAATGNNTGIDWTNAYVDLQLALDVARRYLNVIEIWVTGGHYFTSGTTNRNARFVLADQTALLGVLNTLYDLHLPILSVESLPVVGTVPGPVG